MKILICLFLLLSFQVFPQNIGSWSYVGPPGSNQSGGQNITLSIGPSGTPFVSFFGGGVEVEKFDGNWNLVGNPNIPGMFVNPIIKVGPDDIPYLAFNDDGNIVSVKKFDGSFWVYVGNPLISTFYSDYDFFINKTGVPYVSWIDEFINKISVKKYDGTSWNLVGTANFANGDVQEIRLSVSEAGIPYVVYRGGYSSEYKISVMKFDGADWVYIGSQDFANGTNLAIAVDDSDIPYVGYTDWMNESKINIKKFNGTNWVDVGGSGISEGIGNYLSLMIDPEQHPVAGYVDSNHDKRPTALHYNGSIWEPLGPAGFTPDSAAWPVFDMDMNGKLYCAFQDYSVYGLISVMAYDSVETGIGNHIDPEVNIFPNPASGQVNIILSANKQTKIIEVLDISGKMVRSITSNEDQVTISVSDLISGLYFVKISSNAGTAVGKFIKR